MSTIKDFSVKNTIILETLVLKKSMSKIAFFTAHSSRYASFDVVFDIEKYCIFHVNISWYPDIQMHCLSNKGYAAYQYLPTHKHQRSNTTYSYFVNSVVRGVRKLINLSLRQFSAWKLLCSVWSLNILGKCCPLIVTESFSVGLTGLVNISTFPVHYNQFKPGMLIFCQISD